jgi:hypothetical protein
MNPAFFHTPYNGSSRPFTIGLKQLDLNSWIEVDSLLFSYLAEKEHVYTSIPEKVFVEELDTRSAQREVLDMLAEHLLRVHPDLYRAVNGEIEIGGKRRVETLNVDRPLKAASLLVQEDLILMRRNETGWRLVAGSLCFPSSWSLTEKFGKPLELIHEPVPAFGSGTRNAGLINRIFDNMLVEQPVERFNWTLQSGNDLYHPLSGRQRDERAETRPSKFPGDEHLAKAFIRVERQTLRKLPVSRDILFTIRICLDPLRALSEHPDGRRIAMAFADQLSALDLAQLDYKGLTADRDRLISVLMEIAAPA